MSWNRIRKGDRVEIVDNQSQYFKQQGVIKDIVSQELLNNGKSIEMITFKIELDSTGGIIDISNHPLSFRQQIKWISFASSSM